MASLDSVFPSTFSDALLVVPPFADPAVPAAGPHLLQACARLAGFEVGVLYAGLLLAAEIGEENYVAICRAPIGGLLGERVFAASAYGVPQLGRRALDKRSDGGGPLAELYPGVRLDELAGITARATAWMDDLLDALARRDFPVVGCSTMFAQTSASLALLGGLKRRREELCTILGGANCEGDMAEGVLALSDAVDYVFSGEAEEAFVEFLRAVRAGHPPPRGVVSCSPCVRLDDLPVPDYTEYFEQLHCCLPGSTLTGKEGTSLPYRTSRGCCWGHRRACTFCGLNGEAIAYRTKLLDRVFEDLKHLLRRHPSRSVCFYDSIIPRERLRELLPRLAAELPPLRLLCQTQTDLSLDDVLALKEAGFRRILAGVEALSPALLTRIRKGGSVAERVALLRYARAVGLEVAWSLLYGFPGDEREEYEVTLACLPLLRHLQPPVGFFPLYVERFSAYFRDPAAFGLEDLRPTASYAAILPEGADAGRVAYRFDAEFRSASLSCHDLTGRIAEEVRSWQTRWQCDREVPMLEVTPLSENLFLLIDTRGLRDAEPIIFLSRAQAATVLAGRGNGCSEHARWALDRQLALEADGVFIPLATSGVDRLLAFEAEVGPEAGPADVGAIEVGDRR